METGTWSRGDPRHHVGKRSQIIVLIDGLTYPGFVDVKEGWNVFLTGRPKADRSFLGADDEWPGWKWAWWPRDQAG